MKAIAVVPSRRDVRCLDVEEPRLTSPTGVRVEILDVGVCGTDREIAAFAYGTPPAGAEHLIVGHESLGRVVEIGSAVTRVAIGDLVVPMVRRPCAHDDCTACRAGRQDFCFTGDFRERGIKGLHGFMTEQVVDDEQWMNVVPAALRDVGVLVEPLTIAEKALLQLWLLQERLPWGCPHEPGKRHGHCRRAVILGGGPVGLLGAMAFAAQDFDTVVYSRDVAGTPKARLAEAIGARYVSSHDVAPADMDRHFGPIDVVYEASGASHVAFELMTALGPNGVFIFTGVPGRKERLELDTSGLMRNLVLKNQVVLGTVNAGRDAFEAAVRDLGRFVERWPDAVRALITSRHAPGEYAELLTGEASGIKRVIEFART